MRGDKYFKVLNQILDWMNQRLDTLKRDERRFSRDYIRGQLDAFEEIGKRINAELGEP